jgi:hypothetical protein
VELTNGSVHGVGRVHEDVCEKDEGCIVPVIGEVVRAGCHSSGVAREEDKEAGLSRGEASLKCLLTVSRL